MAFVSNMDDEQKPADQTGGALGPVSPSGGGGAVRLSPSSAVSTVGGGGTTAGQPNLAGGQFASLQNYLAANQGQAEPLSNKITAGADQQYSTLQGQNQSTLNDISRQVAANAVPGASDTLAQEATNPVSFASNPSNIPSFQKLLGATYSGPASAESTPGFQAQQTAINNAINTGQQATQTEAGRENLLAQNEAAPTTGVTALNSAILSESPTALSNVESAYKPFSNLVTGLNQGAQDVNKNIAQTQGDITSANAAANKQISDQINALNTNVNSQYGNLQKQYQTANTAANTLASGLQGGTLPAGVGIDPGLQTFLNNSVSPWISAYGAGKTPTYNFANAVPTFPTNPAPTLAQAGTPQDYAQAQAFQNLLAGLNTGTPAPVINPSTAAQAGTYNTAALPAVNNQTLANDIQTSLAPFGYATQPNPYNSGEWSNFAGILQALNQYQGKPANTPVPGMGAGFSTYSTPTPITIT